jgi:hypothetical protein
MKWQGSLFALILLASAVFAQGPTQEPVYPLPLTHVAGEGVPPLPDDGGAPIFSSPCPGTSGGGPLSGTHDFDNFIGFMSNPLFNIDPRAVTELYPLTGQTWVEPIPALPSGNIWIPPVVGLTVALSDRLAVGLNQGGYATADFNGNRHGLFRDRFGVLHDRAGFAGDHEGWLNLGGFAQYTLLEDVPGKSLVTAGLRLEVPSGTKDIFQGIGPTHLAPYLTAGKGFGDFHVLANLGYQFPVGSGGVSNLFYGSVHLDRQLFGWLYPLVEFNWVYHTTHVDIDLPTRRGFIDLNDFEASGNLVTLAVGANAVLVRGKLEAGAVYTTPISTQRDFSFNGFLIKMVYRF